MKSPAPRLSFFAATLFVTASALAEPRLWLDDHFADGERLTQSLPASAEWFSSSGGTSLTATSGALMQDGGGRHVVAYFAPADAPAYLAPGETLVLSYEIAVSGPLDGPGALRVALFNSAGKRVVTDKQARTDDFITYVGYMGASNPAPSKNQPLRLFKRTQGGDTLIGALPSFLAIGEPGGSLQAMADGATYQGTLTIQRSASGESNTVTHGFSGGDLAPHQVTTVDSLEPVTVFDTVVFHAGTKAARGFTLKSVRVETRKD